MEPGTRSGPEALRDFGLAAVVAVYAAAALAARLIVSAALFNATLWERRNRA